MIDDACSQRIAMDGTTSSLPHNNEKMDTSCLNKIIERLPVAASMGYNVATPLQVATLTALLPAITTSGSMFCEFFVNCRCQ